ncbi:MAG: hydrolase [Thermoleophilaceae bacterium]|nr:hydrolase [Thermoleophilaceae bacterium]
MAARGLLERGRAAVLVVDVQEAFRPAIDGFDRVARRIATLVQGANVLGVPVIVTEQYPRGLGPTVPEVAAHLEGVEPIAKVCFAATDADGFDLGGRDQVVIAGIETHICVSQTAHALLERGVEVHVAADACGSRSAGDREVGLRRMEAAGALPSSVETALFELLGAAGSDEFKRIQGLVK